MEKKIILITGGAGFIGFHLTKKLLTNEENKDIRVIGIDNMNSYYDVELKKARLEILAGLDGYTFVEGDISDKAFMEKCLWNISHRLL